MFFLCARKTWPPWLPPGPAPAHGRPAHATTPMGTACGRTLRMRPDSARARSDSARAPGLSFEHADGAHASAWPRTLRARPHSARATGLFWRLRARPGCACVHARPGCACDTLPRNPRARAVSAWPRTLRTRAQCTTKRGCAVALLLGKGSLSRAPGPGIPGLFLLCARKTWPPWLPTGPRPPLGGPRTRPRAPRAARAASAGVAGAAGKIAPADGSASASSTLAHRARAVAWPQTLRTRPGCACERGSWL